MTTIGEAASTRLVRALDADTRDGLYRYVGQTGTTGDYAVEVAGRRRVYPLEQMRAWHRGYGLGREHPHLLDATSREPLEQVRAVLVAPTLADQLRSQIRGAAADAGLTVTDLAARIDRDRHAVSDALRFGRTGALSMVMAEQMMLGTGRPDWSVRFGSDPDGPVAPPADVTGEAPGVTRMRALAYAHEQRLVEWLDPLEPNRAARARRYLLRTVDGGEHHERAETLVPWLVGLADAAAPAVAASLTR